MRIQTPKPVFILSVLSLALIVAYTVLAAMVLLFPNLYRSYFSASPALLQQVFRFIPWDAAACLVLWLVFHIVVGVVAIPGTSRPVWSANLCRGLLIAAAVLWLLAQVLSRTLPMAQMMAVANRGGPQELASYSIVSSIFGYLSPLRDATILLQFINLTILLCHTRKIKQEA